MADLMVRICKSNLSRLSSEHVVPEKKKTKRLKHDCCAESMSRPAILQIQNFKLVKTSDSY